MARLTSATSRYPSAELIGQIALTRQGSLLQQADAIDTKAATLIGLVGVLLGLLLGSDFVLDRWNIFVSLGAALLVLATLVLAFGVFFPRRYLLNPDIRVLSRHFLHRTPEVTNEAIIRSVNRALPQIERVLSRKSFFVGVASLMIVTALGLIGGRLIYSIEQAPYHASKNPKTPGLVRWTR